MLLDRVFLDFTLTSLYNSSYLQRIIEKKRKNKKNFHFSWQNSWQKPISPLRIPRLGGFGGRVGHWCPTGRVRPNRTKGPEMSPHHPVGRCWYCDSRLSWGVNLKNPPSTGNTTLERVPRSRVSARGKLAEEKSQIAEARAPLRGTLFWRKLASQWNFEKN